MAYEYSKCNFGVVLHRQQTRQGVIWYIEGLSAWRWEKRHANLWEGTLRKDTMRKINVSISRGGDVKSKNMNWEVDGSLH